MIAYISGALVSAGENYIVIDNHGMGYRIFVSGKFLERIPAYGTQIKVYTHMYIREDELTLYGFYSEEELSVFRILIGISGVGPKVAMAILTALTIQELQLAVISEDAKTISKANGVGTKGASRIILELKDKLKMEDMMDAAYEQSIAQDTIDKAKKEAEDIVAAAKTETESKVQDTKSEIELEARKLEAARKSTVEFVARVSAAYQAQAKALVELAKAEKLVQPAQTQETKVDDKTTKIAKPAADEKNAAADKADAPAEDSTRKFDFGELKFGADYDPKKTK